MDRDDGFHSLAEARSWALHQEVAAQLAVKPELLMRARRRVADWMKESVRHPYAAAWHDVLLLPPPRLQQALIDKSDQMIALRQSSPFAGALDAATRWKILKRPELRPRETR